MVRTVTNDSRSTQVLTYGDEHHTCQTMSAALRTEDNFPRILLERRFHANSFLNFSILESNELVVFSAVRVVLDEELAGFCVTTMLDYGRKI